MPASIQTARATHAARVLNAHANEMTPLVAHMIPQGWEQLMRWLASKAPAIRALGGHPDDAFPGDLFHRLKTEAAPEAALTSTTARWRRANWPHLWRGLEPVLIGHALRLPLIGGHWWVAVTDRHGLPVLERSYASAAVITNAGVGFLVDAWDNLVELETMNFHGCGSGNTAETAAQTALVTEYTTQLAPDSTRPAGTRTQPSANVLQSLALATFDAGGPYSVEELGIFSQAATGGGVMYDRTVIAAASVPGSGQLETTWQGTFPAGG